MEVKNNMVQMKVMEEIARMVVRAFYDEETVIVMDVVMFMTKQSGSSVRDEDVAAEAKLQHKSVRRVLSKLEKNYLVKSFTRKETRGGKEMMQQYWRIDYKMLIDAIKLRIHRMKKALHVMPVEAITKYMCNNCTDDDGNHPCWDEHDVQQLQFGIECFEVEKSNDHGGQADIHQRMQKQLSRLIDALKKSEEVHNTC
ncbi:hypothetical protein GUITHDRAFT_106249 [Guillardia theta CCMP2712]|uniref:HTH TFE/IIEalpha-type domain-containing protein n=1 Tax=Guillardia theta (strain CCMP2712) TaxID=905079 RepID=L1JJ42_GUITC|nr:hypothetical protein GUITHDRAFT_106249 [Guillardia theta CCMP2712]EKX48174.1 hypothetical protein GUITHDRAFT_106249 [Guillardia theta CCMP2712]|eukprot:XP_005835154.1 hypothetical protein GUITHDRAFT_106249 [Guillardia theta CCMP2712]